MNSYPKPALKFLVPQRTSRIFDANNHQFYFARQSAEGWGDRRFRLAHLLQLSVYPLSFMHAFRGNRGYDHYGATNWFGVSELMNLRRSLLREARDVDEVRSFESFEEKFFCWCEIAEYEPRSVRYNRRRYWRKNWQVFLGDYATILRFLGDAARYAKRNQIGIRAYGL